MGKLDLPQILGREASNLRMKIVSRGFLINRRQASISVKEIVKKLKNICTEVQTILSSSLIARRFLRFTISFTDIKAERLSIRNLRSKISILSFNHSFFAVIYKEVKGRNISQNSLSLEETLYTHTSIKMRQKRDYKFPFVK